MRITFYYRCIDQRLADAKQKDNERGIMIQEQGKKFASLFRGLPLYTQGFNPHFAGVTFNKGNPPKNWLIWTQPTNDNPVMLPRSPEAVPKKLKQLAKDTQELFRKEWPTEAGTPYHSALLTAMGVGPQAVFGNALSYFYLVGPDGSKVSWIGSTLPLDGKSWIEKEGDEQTQMVGWQEVLASEFAQANEEFGRLQMRMQIDNMARDSGQYTVEPGDTLSGIAERLLGNADEWRMLAEVNNIENPDLIHPGQVLKLKGEDA